MDWLDSTLIRPIIDVNLGWSGINERLVKKHMFYKKEP